MSLTSRILAGLVAGLLLGAAIAAWAPAYVDPVAAVAEPVGGVWVDALKMTIIPLVFSLIVTGICSAAGAAQAGRTAALTLAVFAVGLVASSTFGALTAEGLLALTPVPAGLREAAASGGAQVPETPGIAEWLRSFVPANPIKAAADGAIASLVFFALIFGLALNKVAAVQRDAMVGFFRTIVDAMLVVVGWVLWTAPLGVFALALVVGARAGVGAAGALAHYIFIVSATLALLSLVLYLLAGLALRLGLGRFVKAMSPAMAVAISTQSSLATLPAMIEASKDLSTPQRVRSLVLPLAVSLFRVTSPPGNIAVALYVAHVYGVELSILQIALGVLVAAVVSLAAVGIASAASFFTTLGPICLAMGLPLELLPILLAVEFVPDIFRTIGNVTGDVTVTSLVSRLTGAQPGPEDLEEAQAAEAP